MKILYNSLIIVILLSIHYCYGNDSIINGINNIQISMKNFEIDGGPVVFGRLVNESNKFNNNELAQYLSGNNSTSGSCSNEYTYISEYLNPKIKDLVYESGYLYGRLQAKDYSNGVLSLERLQRLREFLKEWNSTLEFMKGIIQDESYVPYIYGLKYVRNSKSIIKCSQDELNKDFSNFRDCKDIYCPEMVVIPSGSYIMGGTDEEHKTLGVDPLVWPWDQPQHQVTIKKRFAIGKYEITRRQFREFIKETGYKMPIGATTCDRLLNTKTNALDTRVIFEEGLTYESPGEGFTQTDDHPMVAVRREDARMFAKWLSIKTNQTYRLPYEAEWEYVTRANQGYQYYIWGNETKDACKYANVYDIGSWSHYNFKFDHFECNDGQLASAKVGSYLPNQFGVYDLLANAREWVDDCWHYGFEGAPKDGSRWGQENNGLCNFGVLRGGSFFYNTFNVRIAYRNAYFSSQSRSVMWGFRLVREINQ